MRLGGLGFGTDPYAMLCYAVAYALILSEIFRGTDPMLCYAMLCYAMLLLACLLAAAVV